MTTSMACPFCAGPTEQDEIDNGVGMQACGPRGCPACHAYMVTWEEATQEERARGCWREGDRPAGWTSGAVVEKGPGR